MSKLAELIKELCPNGVEFKKIKNICEISRGKVISKDYIKDNSGNFPVYSSQTENNGELGRISTYMFDGNYITWTTDGANAGTVFYRTGKFNVTNVCGLLKVKNENISIKFVYYVLRTKTLNYVNKGMGNPKLMSNVMAEISIPFPPLKIQREIVQVLDSFTKYIALLEKELVLRKKQYAYYRDRLLNFGDEVERQTLGEIAYIKARIGWQNLKRSEYLENGDYYLVTGIDISLNNRVNFNSCYYVSKERYEMDSNIQLRNGDIIVTKDGTIGKVAIIENMDKPAVLNSHLFVIRDISGKLNNKFLMYILLSDLFKSFINKKKTSGTISGLNQSVIIQFPVPIPPIEEQERIVKILDRFDRLCNDLTCGLPAEINARKKQYEYYRDKLLTFQELKRS